MISSLKKNIKCNVKKMVSVFTRTFRTFEKKFANLKISGLAWHVHCAGFICTIIRLGFCSTHVAVFSL